MKHLLVVLGLVLAFLAYKNHMKPPPTPPSPPPAPPPILVAPTPAPILGAEELQKVVNATRDPDENVRWEAAKFLIKLKHPESDAVLFHMLAKDQAVSIRQRVAEMLSERTGPAITQALVAALRDIEPPVRGTALRALARVGDFSTAGAISESLRDMDEGVRLEAMKTLGTLQEKKDEEVRRERERIAAENRRREEEARKRQAEAEKKP
ncbi:MAG: HEAT repeat domain-containing protein [Elusimicrobia bacterium]|nr:HEAT repeat domain-containing protein [Elusimicrobiota bacterium]